MGLLSLVIVYLNNAAEISITVPWDKKESLKSEGYPQLKQRERKFLLQTTNNTGYIRMVFDDLDLPPDSFLKVSLHFSPDACSKSSLLITCSEQDGL